MLVVFLLRVGSVGGVMLCSVLSLYADCACLLRRGVFRVVDCCGAVRIWMRLFTNGSSSHVSVYVRWDLDNSSACRWVCVRVGMRPWYMVVRLMRSMCMSHVQPSFCRGYFVCGYLVLLDVGVGVLFLIPCTIDVGCCVSCRRLGVAGG